MKNLPKLKAYFYLKYLYIPAVFLLVTGGVARVVTNEWTPLYIGCAIAGGVLLTIWCIYNLIVTRKFWQKRSTQAGTNALIATLSLVILLGLINFITIRYTEPIDLTANQLYSLSSQSENLVKQLDKPVTVWIFDKDPTPNDKQLLENYQRVNPQFNFEYVDPSIKIAIAKQFNVQNLGEVYLEYEDKKQFVQNLIEFNQKQPLSEIKLTNAIERIRQSYIPTVYFLQGHGEPELTAQEGAISQAVNSLKDKGYKVEPLNLAQEAQIPESTDAIVIASPKSKLFAQEVAALKQYSDQGGNLLLMIDPNLDPGLDDLLKDWGVELDPRIVIDASGRGELLGFGPATVIITNYGSHPITQELTNRYSIYPLTRPIGTVEADNVEAVSLVVTDEQMWGESDLDSTEITFDPNRDIAGPFDIGVALKRTLKTEETASKSSSSNSPTPEAEVSPSPSNSPTPEAEVSPSPNTSPTPKAEVSPSPNSKAEKQPKESKMVVFGNSTFATDGWFDEQFNGDVFLNSVQWLVTDNDAPLAIRPKEPENRRINLTPLKAGIIAWMSLVIMPILGLILAAITWWKRR
ncbi:MAG: GldG family protein [Microcystaceae cyanobacterium]